MTSQHTETDMGSTRSSVYIPDRLREALDLDVRSPSHVEGLSGRLAAICDRYHLLLAHARPELSRAEWMLALDACNGWASWSQAGETLMLGISAEIEDHCRLNGGHEQWGLTAEQGAALAARIASMSRLEQIAIVEHIERFWRRSDLGTDEALRAAGIVPSDGLSTAGKQ